MRILLLGHPVSHSLSPAMQGAALRATGFDATYEAIEVPPQRLAEYIAMLRDGAYLGANVTVPFKLEAAEHMDRLDADALALGAVNTIVVDGGRLLGHNTDLAGARLGLVDPVIDSLRGSNLLVLGAGGGARALCLALARSQPGDVSVLIAARRAATGEAVADLLRGAGLSATAIAWDDRLAAAVEAGVVANCTPLGLREGEDPLAGVALTGKVVLDLAYRPGGTDLFRRGWREGATAIQGDEMLLQQGAESFRLWTGLEPPLGVMRKALAEAMAR